MSPKHGCVTMCRFYLPIKYFPAANGPAKCKGWVEKPTYLLQVRYRCVPLQGQPLVEVWLQRLTLAGLCAVAAEEILGQCSAQAGLALTTCSFPAHHSLKQAALALDLMPLFSATSPHPAISRA
jgi:hypothetical protein